MGVFTPTTGAGVFATYTADPSDPMCGNGGKMEEERAYSEARQSTESPSTSPAHDAELSPEDDEALALLGPPTLARLTTDEQYGPFYGTEAMVEPGAYAMPTEQVQTGMPLDNMVGPLSEAVAPTELLREAPRPMEPMQYQETMQGAPVSPTGQQQPMMYTEAMMQQAMQNAVQQAMQQQQMPVQVQQLPNGQQIQYVPVPTPMPVQMMPQMMPQMVPVPMPMNFQAPGQMPMQYYMMPQTGEQQQQQEEAQKDGNFLESLMPKGWRKRQRPSKRPASRVQKVPSGRKIFVGGLSPNSTAESLIKHFCEFGKISDASVIHEAVSRKSRGFGYVEFAEKIPDGLLEMEHFIDQRRCGVRGYNYDPAEDTTIAAASA
jgi:hypothetical protein